MRAFCAESQSPTSHFGRRILIFGLSFSFSLVHLNHEGKLGHTMGSKEVVLSQDNGQWPISGHSVVT